MALIAHASTFSFLDESFSVVRHINYRVFKKKIVFIWFEIRLRLDVADICVIFSWDETSRSSSRTTVDVTSTHRRQGEQVLLEEIAVSGCRTQR